MASNGYAPPRNLCVDVAGIVCTGFRHLYVVGGRVLQRKHGGGGGQGSCKPSSASCDSNGTAEGHALLPSWAGLGVRVLYRERQKPRGWRTGPGELYGRPTGEQRRTPRAD